MSSLLDTIAKGFNNFAKELATDLNEYSKQKKFNTEKKKRNVQAVAKSAARMREPADLLDLLSNIEDSKITEDIRSIAHASAGALGDIYIPKFFSLTELVDPRTFSQLGERAWGLLDRGLLFDLDTIRAKIGRIVINDWNSNGRFSMSGYRPITSNVGASYSLHRLGKALDLKPVDVSVEEGAKVIERLAKEGAFYSIRRMENPKITGSWLHVDTGFGAEKIAGIKIFNP